jgi:dynein heavy chain, axonemal
VIKKFCD